MVQACYGDKIQGDINKKYNVISGSWVLVSILIKVYLHILSIDPLKKKHQNRTDTYS